MQFLCDFFAIVLHTLKEQKKNDGRPSNLDPVWGNISDKQALKKEWV